MKIKELMSRRIVAVNMDATLEKIKTIFEDKKFHHLLVTDVGELVGVISDRDLLKSISPKVDSVAATNKDIATLHKKAHQIMSRQLKTLGPEENVIEAIHMFAKENVSSIPIIDKDNKPVGILSWRDIIDYLSERYTA